MPIILLMHKNTANEIIARLKKVQIKSIQDSADLMEAVVIEKAVQYLLKARHIVVFGLSPNVFWGKLFRRKMTTIGIRLLFSVFFTVWLHLGVIGIAYAMCLDWSLRGVIFWLRTKSNVWKKIRLI